MKRGFILGFLCLFVCIGSVGAQTGLRDSLNGLLEKHPQQDTLRAKWLFLLASEIKLSDTETAERMMNEAYEIAVKCKSQRWVMEGLCQKAMMNYRRADYDEAEKQYAEAMEIAKDYDFELIGAKLKYDLGILLNNRGQSQKALVLFEEAFPIFKKHEDRNCIVKCLLNLGKVAGGRNEVSKAMEYYMEGLRLAESYSLRKELGLLYSNLGALYFNLDEPDKAVDYFHRAVPIYEELNDLGLLAGAYQQVGTVYILLNKNQEAKENLLKSKELYRKLGYKNQLRHSLNSLGVLAKRQGKYDEALEYYQEIYAFSETVRDTTMMITGLSNMASVYIEQTKYAKALGILEKADVLSLKIGDIYTRKNITENISGAYHGLGKYDESLSWYKKYKDVCDTIFDKEKHKQIEELSVRYDVERKKLTIDNLEAANQLQFLSLQRNRIVIGGIGVLLLLTFCFLVFFRKLYRETLEANRNLVRKNQEVLQQQEKSRLLLHITGKADSDEIPVQEKLMNLPAGITPEMIRNMERTLIEEEAFKDNELTLGSLAQRLNTNTTYLSRIINEYYGQNFSLFISTLRINAAQKMLSDSRFDQFTIEGVAREVGFNSKSSFNTAFKSTTGLTPSAYKKGRG